MDGKIPSDTFFNNDSLLEKQRSCSCKPWTIEELIAGLKRAKINVTSQSGVNILVISVKQVANFISDHATPQFLDDQHLNLISTNLSARGAAKLYEKYLMEGRICDCPKIELTKRKKNKLINKEMKSISVNEEVFGQMITGVISVINEDDKPLILNDTAQQDDDQQIENLPDPDSDPAIENINTLLDELDDDTDLTLNKTIIHIIDKTKAEPASQNKTVDTKLNTSNSQSNDKHSGKMNSGLSLYGIDLSPQNMKTYFAVATIVVSLVGVVGVFAYRRWRR